MDFSRSTLWITGAARHAFFPVEGRQLSSRSGFQMHPIMRVGDDVELDGAWMIRHIRQETGSDDLDPLAQGLERVCFRRKTLDVAVLDIPDLGFLIPGDP